MGANVSIGRQRVRVRRREKEWAIGESSVIHQRATSEQDWNKEKTEIMNEKKCVQYESVCEVLTALPVRAMLSTNERHERQTTSDTHRQEGMDNVGFDRTQGFVSDHHKDLLLFLQADEVPKPRLLSQSGSQTRKSVRAITRSRRKDPKQTQTRSFILWKQATLQRSFL